MEKQMTFEVMLTSKLKDLLTTIIAVWAVSILGLTTLDEVESRQNQKIISKLMEESFEEYVIYHSINPVLEEVHYGAEAKYVSDMEVKKGGFRLKWDEYIECDYSPYDGVDYYEYYKEAQSTSRYYSGPVNQRTPDQRLAIEAKAILAGTAYDPLQHPFIAAEVAKTGKTAIEVAQSIDAMMNREGFPVRSKSGAIIKYPEKDANCRLVSFMTQYHPHGVEKYMAMAGESVKVRRLE